MENSDDRNSAVSILENTFSNINPILFTASP